MNGFGMFIIAALFLLGPLMIHSSIHHDRLLDEPDRPDYESLADDVDQRHTDDADAWRKGES